MQPIITSLLDTDLYKFTMMQCIWHHFPDAMAEFRFTSRKPVDLGAFAQALTHEIQQLCRLQFTPDDLNYLASLPYMKADFIDFLRAFQLSEQHVQISTDNGFDLRVKGPWVNTILFEVPLLAIISEIFYRHHFPHEDFLEAKTRLSDKIAFVKTQAPDLQFSDFGTRRRFAKAWQETVVATFAKELPAQFIGTSNILLAKQFNIKPIGTMAHEYLQACQVLAPQLKGSQKFALEIWLKEYPEHLKIALTDTLTMDVFLQEFDQNLAQRYDGLRQDSGDPFEWGEKALRHYQAFNIDAHSKTFVFSNSLTLPMAAKINDYFKARSRCQFGIGTNLTNDVGHTPLDIVIKMIYVNQKPVVKISDSPGKMVCEDKDYLHLVKQTFQLKD
jgi:nicotinate phosphoribosyltransferase